MNTPPLRADAARNRAAIIAAARAVFSERGLDAPLDDIAKVAGIANATLYRRFADRAELVEAVFLERMADLQRLADEANELADPWERFEHYLLGIFAAQADDRGIAALITMDLSELPDVAAARNTAFATLTTIVDDAITSGQLRADATTEDIAVVLLANAGLVHATYRDAPEASERLAHLLLDGLRSDGASTGAGPVDPRRLEAAMRTHSAALGFRCPPSG